VSSTPYPGLVEGIESSGLLFQHLLATDHRKITVYLDGNNDAPDSNGHFAVDVPTEAPRTVLHGRAV
jgi:hypothetical protein